MTPAMTPMTNSITRAVINTRVAPHLRSRYCRLRLSSSISSILSSAAALLIRDMVSTESQQLSPNILILPRHTVNERKNALALWAQESKVIWFAELLREIHNQRSFYCPSDFEINLKQEVSVNQLRGSYLHWDQMQIVNKIEKDSLTFQFTAKGNVLPGRGLIWEAEWSWGCKDGRKDDKRSLRSLTDQSFVFVFMYRDMTN